MGHVFMTSAAATASPLAHPVYRRLFAAQVVSLVGTGMSTVALALLAYELAGGDAGAVLGTALALKMVAYLGVAPAIGAVAHKLPRKRLLIALDVARAGLVLCLPLVDQVWQLFVLIFLINAGSAAFTPLFQATIPDILPDEGRYTRALSLSRLAYDLENMASPTLAALAVAAWSFDILFVANGAGFLVSALLVGAAALPPPRPSDRPSSLRHNLVFGIAGYLKTPRLRGLLSLYVAVAAGGAMVIVNTVVYVRDRLGLGEDDTAIALIAAGTGSMIVALSLPRLLDRVPDRPVMLLGGAVLTAALALGTLTPDFAGLLGLWLALGIGSSLVQTPAARLVRRSCRESDRAAFFSANFALSHGAWLVGYLMAGWLGADVGLTAAFTGLAVLAGGATLAAPLLWPAGDPVTLAHTHPAVSHQHPHVHDEHHRHPHEGWEGPEPHVHPHYHPRTTHRHPFVIDLHHPHWPA